MQHMDTVKIEVDIPDVLDCDDGDCGDVTVATLISRLTAALEMVPVEYRSVARLEIYAYDWDGSAVTFERPMTDVEIAARHAAIEQQRQNAEARFNEEWVRNVRLYVGIANRSEAREFIATNPEANAYHPDVFKKPHRY